MPVTYPLYDCPHTTTISYTYPKQIKEQKNKFFTLIPIVNLVKDNFMTSKIQELKQRINEIRALDENWDGYGACRMPKLVINNTYRFIDTLYENLSEISIDPDNITPTPYGSIEIDLESQKGLVSLEIGQNGIGFFTKYIKEDNIESNGEKTDFKSIPEALQKAMEILYS